MSAKFTVSREVEGGESVVRLTASCRSPVVIFLIVWCAFWTMGITLAISRVLQDPREYFLYLWLTMALFAEVVVLGMILKMLFGKTVITIRRGCGTSFTGVGAIGLRRRFRYGSAEDFVVEEERRSGRHGTHWVHVLRAPSQDRKGATVVLYSDAEEEKVQALCREIVSALGGATGTVPENPAETVPGERTRAPVAGAAGIDAAPITDYEAYFRNQGSK